MSATPGIAKPSAAGFAVRILKLVISIFYLALDWTHRQVRRLQGKAQIRTSVVLYYHSVPAAYRDRFEKQISILAHSRAAIDVLNMNTLAGSRPSVAITFDDALESFAVNAVPVLEQLNIPATVFAVVDAMGGQPVWGEGYFSPDERVMSAEALRSLPQNIAVGSHTLSHTNLLAMSSDAAGREITESRRRLEQMLDRPITLFSFPFGAFDDSTVRQCFEAGYERVFTTEPELLTRGRNPFVIGRVAADPWDWPLEFRLKIAGAYCWQPWTRTLRNGIRNRVSADDNRPSPVMAATGTAQRTRGL